MVMFSGVYTATVTPFAKDGSVDFGRLCELIEFQIAGGVSGIVPMGTTGESPTVDFDEHHKVIEETVRAVKGRVQVVAGTGANSTAEAIELTQHAKDAGADATLQVTPYYNKPNALGLVRHFSAVADLGLPVMLYNVPGRSGRDIPIDVVVELSKHPNVKSIKEAAGSVDRVSAILTRCELDVLSGDDSLTIPMMSVGAKGIVSVASNVAPKAVSEMVAHALAGRWNEARAIHTKYYNLFNDLFMDTNPIPVKTALAMMGKVEEVFRLPLCETSEANKTKLRALLKSVGLL